MVVAGGAGTRLWPLTATRPKPLLGFCGAPFLTGVIRRLATVGVRHVLLVVGADTDPFTMLERDAADVGVSLSYVPERQPLDTAGGVRAALDQVSGSFLVLNGDILTDLDFSEPIAAHRAAGAEATLTLTRVTDTSAFGVCVLDGTRIVDFVEKPAPGTLPGQDAVNAGCYVLEPETLARFATGRLSFEREVFPGLVAAGAHVEGYVADAFWADLGTPQRYLDGHRAALEGALSWPTLDALPPDRAGVRRAGQVQTAADVHLVGPALVEDGVIIDGGARVGPNVVLGRGVHVGTHAVVRDSVLGAGTQVGSGTHLDRVIAGDRVDIGREVTAAHGAVLGDGAKVADQNHLEADSRIVPEA